MNWLADKIEQWPTGKLLPYARNARTHSEEQPGSVLHRFQWIPDERIGEVEQEIAKDLGEQCETLRALLDEAPHTIGCSIHMKQRNGYSKDGECDCWKSRILRAGG